MPKRKGDEVDNEEDELQVGDVVRIASTQSIYFRPAARRARPKLWPRDSGLLTFGSGSGPGTVTEDMRGVVRGFVEDDDYQGKPKKLTVVAVTTESAKGIVFMGGSDLEKVDDAQHIPAAIMKKLWESRAITADVMLIGQNANKEENGVAAHSCVVGASSPALAAAFNNGMSETSTRQLKIQGVSKVVIETVLECIYIGKIPPRDNVLDCLAFAHTYMMIDVAKVLGGMVIQAINADNAGHVVRLLKDFDTMEGSDTCFVDELAKSLNGNAAVMKTIIKSL